MAEHAKNRPPSSAARWLSCPASASVLLHYPNDESDASIKGTLAHTLLDAYLTFGVKPNTDDPDMDLNVIDAGDWAKERKAQYGKDCKMHVETRLDIPQTGEFGTADIVFETPTVLEIVDYKNGYVPVEIYMNAQMMTYLLGAIAKFGTRKKYIITVIQPNYNHRDGIIRSWSPDKEQLEWFENEVKYSMQYPDNFAAGKHCKTTYCAHRGNCATFMAWGKNNAGNAWWPHEINATTDEELAAALDHAEVLHGLRDEMRKAAIVRIMQHGRSIEGYKCVKSKSNREFAGDEGREACYNALLHMGYELHELTNKKTTIVGKTTFTEQTLLTVADVERMVKQKFKIFGRGKWKEVWDEQFAPHIRVFSGSITLERAIDGRPSVTPGSEFDELKSVTNVASETTVTII